MSAERKSVLAVPLQNEDRDRLQKRAEDVGCSPTTYARMVLLRDIRSDERKAS